MNGQVAAFYKSLAGKRCAVCGVGVSNRPLIALLCDAGAIVTACDRRTREQLGAAADELAEAGVMLRLGEGYLTGLDAEIIFRTPGLPFTLPEITAYRKRGVAVTSEMEVFFALCPATILAVTGSDGKTTTTSLIAEMLRNAGKRVFLGGNIGTPLLPQAADMTPDDFAVAELSSFQLISMRRSPRVAVVTNISPNHLDIHRNMEEYIDAKRQIVLHQDGFGRAVLNLDNEVTASFAGHTRGDTLYFSRRRSIDSGAYLGPDGIIYFAKNGQKTAVIPRDAIRVPGDHNVENYLAAICAVWGIADIEAIRKTADTFTGVAHRIEFVRECDGIRYYNDSIATTPTRALAGMGAFDRRVILIAGGYDKQIPFDTLGPGIVERVKCLVLLGTTADKIEAAVKAAPGWSSETTAILRVGNLAEAVAAARDFARAGDIVLLSPACASYDMYPNFAARGEHFKELVEEL